MPAAAALVLLARSILSRPGWAGCDPDQAFLPHAPGEDGTRNFRVEDLAIEGEDDAGALLYSPRQRAPGRPDTCIILCHGGGSDRLFGFWHLLSVLLARGHTVLTAHLAGHGLGGSDLFSLENARRRLDRLVQAMRHRPGRPRVLLLGQSLGAALALDLLARGGRVEGVVSVSAPTHLQPPRCVLAELRGLFQPGCLRQALRYGGIFSLLPAYRWFRRSRFPIRLPPGQDYIAVFARAIDRLALLRRLRKRHPDLPLILLVHGREDSVIPIEQAVQLQRALGGRASLVVAGGVNHLYPLFSPAVLAAIADWVEVPAAVSRA